MNDEDLYAEYLEHGLDSTSGRALDAATRDELDVLRRILAARELWTDPPPDLADAIAADIRKELDYSGVVGSPREASRNRHRAVHLVAAAAALVVVLGVGAIVIDRSGDPAEPVALSATEIVPAASGSVAVEQTGSGLSLALSVEDLPPAAPGTFYQAWMKGPQGSVPIGTFHAREADGPIALWSGVDVEEYPTMTVTVQQEGAGPESSGRVVLTGDLRAAD